MTSLYDITARLGGRVSHGGAQAKIPGPGHSRHDDSLSLERTEDGRIVYFTWCACGHSHRQVMDYLGLTEQEAEKQRPTDRMRSKDRQTDAKVRDTAVKWAFCERVWSETRPLRGTLAVTYLQRRGIALVTPPTVLRYLAKCPKAYADPDDPMKTDQGRPMRFAPAMVALVQDRGGNPIGIHCTYLAPDGSCHDGRLMFGDIAGGAIRLGAHTDDLAIAEGIEFGVQLHGPAGAPVLGADVDGAVQVVLSAAGRQAPLRGRGLRRQARYQHGALPVDGGEIPGDRSDRRCPAGWDGLEFACQNSREV